MVLVANVALLSIIHDKKGALYQPLSNAIDIISESYENKYVAISNETDKRLHQLLIQKGFHVFVIQKNGAVNARRKIFIFN